MIRSVASADCGKPLFATLLLFCLSMPFGAAAQDKPGYSIDSIAEGIGRALAISIAIEKSVGAEHVLYAVLWPTPNRIRHIAFETVNASHGRYRDLIPGRQRKLIASNYLALILGEAANHGDSWQHTNDVSHRVDRISIRSLAEAYPILGIGEFVDAREIGFRDKWSPQILQYRLAGDGDSYPGGGTAKFETEAKRALRVATAIRICQWCLLIGGLLFTLWAIAGNRMRVCNTQIFSMYRGVALFAILAGLLIIGEMGLVAVLPLVAPDLNIYDLFVGVRGLFSIVVMAFGCFAASRLLLEDPGGAPVGLRHLHCESRSPARLACWSVAAIGLIWFAHFGHLLFAYTDSSLELSDNVLFAFGIWGGVGRFALAFATYSVLRPILEEFLFRYILYGALKSRLSRSVAIILSALVFMIFHYGGGQDLVAIFLIGTVLALVREYSGSIFPGMVAHIANNLWLRFGGMAIVELI